MGVFIDKRKLNFKLAENRKDFFYWFAGTVLCAFGVALCTKGDFGLSMVAAPPFVFHVYLQRFFAWFTQGTSEYFWQALLIIILCIIVKKFRARYLLSFLTAVFSGLVIDFSLMILGGPQPFTSMPIRIVSAVAGELFIAFAIACLFKTTWPVQAYELVVKEITRVYKLNQTKVKWCFDIINLVIAVLFCALVSKTWQGIGVGTVIITIVNAPLIAFFGKCIEKLSNK